MGKFDSLLQELEQQEKDLQFKEFTNETALELGTLLIQEAKKNGHKITIDIMRNGHQLFHYAFEGTGPDNDRWIKGKVKVSNLMNHSSYHCQVYFENREKTIEEDFHLSHLEYLPYGGSFPIMIANVGMVGSITVSGLASDEDHRFVTGVIKKFLNK